MRAIPFTALEVTGGYWKDKLELMREKTVWAVYDRFADTGRISTMNCLWREGMPNKPHIFWGSDVFKWMEGAAYLLETKKDEKLLTMFDSIIRDVESAISEDGYYNSYFNTTGEKRFEIRDKHELYSLGHMIEAAIAIDHATGDGRLLNVARRGADLVDRLFRVENSADFETPGHEEIELALVKLYRYTGEKKYLDLAAHFVSRRGRSDKDAPVWRGLDPQDRYSQSHLPVTEQDEAVGHAVRAVYLYCAMADLAAETGDEALKAAAEKLFDNIYGKKMYLTGAIGALDLGEAFSCNYHLPNREAYAETCAALGLALFAGRMSNLTPDGRYGDAAERALYNGMMSGVSLDGTSFFYENPLEVDRAAQYIPYGHKIPLTRRRVFDCSCCPPNVLRMVPSVAGLVFGEDDDRVYVHQYIACRGEGMSVETNYPYDGTVHAAAKGKKLAIRRPAWCDSYKADAPCTEANGYLYFDQEDVTVTFDMTPCFVAAADAVHDDQNRAAVIRGPIVYCIEGQDQAADLHLISVDPEKPVSETDEKFAGFPVLTAEGVCAEKQSALYAKYRKKTAPVTLRLIPYFTFANRGEDDMRVWIPVR